MIMDRTSIATMCAGIADALRDCPSVECVQSYDEITEGIPDTPCIQVLWDSHTVDDTSDIDRTTFKAEVRHSEYVITIYLYAKQRSNIAEDMQITHKIMDEIDAVFEAQDTCEPFGIDGCKGFRWTANRTLLDYTSSGADFRQYTGALILVSLIFY